MGTVDFVLPRRAFRSTECLEVEALLFKKAIMFFTAGGGAACLNQSQVSLRDPG